MMNGNEKTRSSPSDSDSHKVLRNGTKIRVRPYRKKDTDRIRSLYMLTMTQTRGSPHEVMLRSQFTTTSSFVVYALFIAGLVLSVDPATQKLGAILCLLLVMVFAGSRLFAHYMFSQYVQKIHDGDLANISDVYGMKPAAEDEENLVPTGPFGFWVAEAYSEESDYCEIVGFVGLNFNTNKGPGSGKDHTTSEVRRMVVSPTHRRLGIGAALLHTVIAHAREQGLSSVFLTTTCFQIPAMRMYEKLGFVVQWKKYPMKFIPTFSIWVVEMKFDLTKV